MRQRFTLTTFGGLSLRTDDGPVVSLGARRLSFLAVLAAAGPTGLPREKIAALFWPESDLERARAALKQLTYTLRKVLGAESVVIGATDLRIDEKILESDVASFAAAIASGDDASAARLYAGPFLDGVNAGSSPELDQHLADLRERFASAHQRAVIVLRDREVASGNDLAAARWAERVVAGDRAAGPPCTALMEILVRLNDLTGALRAAEQHAAWRRLELELPPDASVSMLEARVRQEMATCISPQSRVEEVAPAWPESTPTQVTAPALEYKRLEPRSMRRTRPLAAAAIVMLFAATVVAMQRTAARRAAPRETRVALVPFRVAATDTSLAFLGEGMIDLLWPRMNVAGAPPVVASTRAIGEWRARQRSGRALSDDEALGFAADAEAPRAIIGSVMANGGSWILEASLIDVASRHVLGRATASGAPSQLSVIADRLAAGLLAAATGNSGREPLFSATPLPAVRAYLEGRSAFRDADYRRAFERFETALNMDSSFVVAALDLSRAAGWIGEGDVRRRSLDVAWQHRDRLLPADRTLLNAIVGPAYPAPSDIADRVAAWDEVVRIDPNRADSWFELGDQLFHGADLMGDSSNGQRIAPVLARAIALDSTYAPALIHRLQAAARAGDTATVRRWAQRAIDANSSSGESDFARWRAALALGSPGSALADVRTRFDSIDTRSLVDIALTALSDGIAIDDGARAMQAVLNRATSRNERADALLGLYAIDQARGRVDSASLHLRRLASELNETGIALFLPVAAAIYGNGDTALAGIAASRLEAVFAAADTASGPALQRFAGNAREATVNRIGLCTLAQWHAWRGANEQARHDVDRLRRFAPTWPNVRSAGNQYRSEPELCAAAIQAWLDVRAHAPQARGELAHLDSVLARGPVMGTLLESELPLLTARLFEQAGDTASALRAVRRRGYFYKWPYFRASELAMEARLTGSSAP